MRETPFWIYVVGVIVVVLVLAVMSSGCSLVAREGVALGTKLLTGETARLNKRLGQRYSEYRWVHVEECHRNWLLQKRCERVRKLVRKDGRELTPREEEIAQELYRQELRQ